MIAAVLFLSLFAAPIVTPDDVPTATPVYAGVAISDADIETEIKEITDQPMNEPTTPLVSINTDILDMSWTGAMDLGDPMLRPSGIILPFLENHPIDNLEVKFRLLNVKF